jgi:hypothetical protein
LKGRVPRAQRPKTPVIGYLGTESPDQLASRLRAFREGLRGRMQRARDRNDAFFNAKAE